MKRLIAMMAVLATLTAACAESGAQPLGPAPSTEPPTPSTSPSPGSPSASPSPTPTQSMTYELWFNYDLGGRAHGEPRYHDQRRDPTQRPHDR